MKAAYWEEIIVRITLQDAVNVDDLTGPMDLRRNPVGKSIFPKDVQLSAPGISFRSEEMAAIGCRITEERDDITQIALSLALLAMEKEVEVIILNHIDYCGLERFGFRCERVTGATPQDRENCEEQIRMFWGIDFVIGA